MDIVSALISLVLFAAFVPGVLLKFPRNGSHKTVLMVHAVLFALVNSMVMWYYWHKVKGYPELFGNYGPAGCPPTHTMGINQAGQPDCVSLPNVKGKGTSLAISSV